MCPPYAGYLPRRLAMPSHGGYWTQRSDLEVQCANNMPCVLDLNEKNEPIGDTETCCQRVVAGRIASQPVRLRYSRVRSVS